MICRTCRKAADTVIVASSIEEVLGAQQLLHAECPGGTWCDCQHEVRQAITAQVSDRV